ncbi:MAG TPA: RagB/SusD family nutrient uptake outer membrane protein [Ohtaekwangia sp.]
MKRYIISILSAVLLTGITSCVGDLDTEPLNDRITTANQVFKDPASYKEFLAKLYGSMTLTGQRGEYGMPEISAPDEGTTSFMRTYWSLQEISTDECISAWGDPGLVELHGHNWSEQNFYNQLLYQRVFINIMFCNEYIRVVPPKIESLPASMHEEVKRYVEEARFLRAFFYSVAIDLWGNVPFVTEQDAPGGFLPKQISRAALFEYIESELLDIIPGLAEPGENEYARADQAAAWMLLAKLYLNAEVYLGPGNKRYTECAEYCNKIISSGVYSLNDSYRNLFLADNHTLRNEIIFPIAEDGNSGRNYGGVTFIIHAAVGGAENPEADFGINFGWSGNRFTNTFADKFADKTGDTDSRALFYTNGQTLDISNPTQFTEGYLSTKFKNKTSAGVNGVNAIFVDTDFPLFRYADVYLMYAEAQLRGAAGTDANTALEYINEIRERAYGDGSGNITSDELTLDFILDERARELHWEAQRRTDLIRFGKFTGGSYLWDWKGNIKSGVATPAHLYVYPLPATDLAVNTNLDQNDDY